MAAKSDNKGTKTDSEKALAFKSRAASRTGKIVKAIRLMHPLCGRNYESTPELRAQVYETLTAEVAKLKTKWEAPSGKADEPEFTFAE